MKISVISNSLVNVILLLLYMEPCCFVTIIRELRDESDVLGERNCNRIAHTFVNNGRCRCDTSRSSILSTNTGQIACIADSNIDRSKYAWILFSTVSFLNRDSFVTVVLVHNRSFMTEHIIPSVTFY